MGFIKKPSASLRTARVLQAVYPGGNQRGTLNDFKTGLRLGSCARTMP
jgi:hypothetical protein